MSEKKEQIKFYAAPPLKEKIQLRAKDEGLSLSEFILKALQLYITKDIEDENLILAKLTSMDKKIESLSKKNELSEKLDLEFYQYYFLFSPELPDDARSAQAALKRAGERTRNFLVNFRRRYKQMPSLMESVFGQLLEEEVINHPPEENKK